MATGGDNPKRMFLSVVEAQIDAMYRTALRLLHNREDAQDAVQEALHNGWRGLSGFTAGEGMKPWLFRILVNTCIDQLRARKRRGDWVVLFDVDDVEPQGLPGNGASPEDSLANMDLSRRVQLEIERLVPAQQMVVQLVIVEQQSYEEAAAALGLPVGTVRSRLSRARAQLCSNLAGMLHGEPSTQAERTTPPLRLVK